MIEIEKYNELHPNCTLQEYIDYVTYENEQAKKDEDERVKNYRDWFKNLKGKYFLINFNSNSYLAVYFDKAPTSLYENNYNTYKVLKTEGTVCYEQRKININWLHNPYSKFDNCTDKCKEITKEEYDYIASIANESKEKISKINFEY